MFSFFFLKKKREREREKKRKEKSRTKKISKEIFPRKKKEYGYLKLNNRRKENQFQKSRRVKMKIAEKGKQVSSISRLLARRSQEPELNKLYPIIFDFGHMNSTNYSWRHLSNNQTPQKKTKPPHSYYKKLEREWERER